MEDGSSAAGGEGALADGCAGDDAAARRRWLSAKPSAAVSRCPPLRWTVLVKSTVMLTEMVFMTPERGPGPRTVVAVGPPRENSAPEGRFSEALGRETQAISAGSTHWSMMSSL